MNMDQSYEFQEEFQEGEGIDIKKYLLALYRRKWLILAIFFGITIPWVIYVKRQPPVYEAYALIRFKNYESENSQLLNRSRITELRSRTFAERVVAQLGLSLHLDEELGLSRQEVFSEFSTTTAPIPGKYELHLTPQGNYSLYLVGDDDSRNLVDSGSVEEIREQAKSVNGFTFRLASPKEPLPRVIKFRISKFRSAVKSLRAHTQVDLDRSGTLMTVWMTDRDPVLVTKMVNSLSQIFVDESISLKKKSVERARKILEEKKTLAEEKLRESNEALKRFKESHFISLDAEVEKQVESLSNFETQQRGLIEERDELNVLLEKLKPQQPAQAADLDVRYIYRQIASHSSFEKDPNMGILRQQLTDLEARRAALLEKVTESHHDVQEVDTEIDDVRDKIRKTAEKRLAQLDDKIGVLDTRIASLRRKLQNLPTEQLKLSELTLQTRINGDIYSMLLTRFQEAQISEAVETEDIDILDPAIQPEYPTNRNKNMKALMGAFFAFMLGIVVAFVLDFLDKSIRSPEDVKKYLKLPLLGTIPKIEFDHEYELQDSEKLRQIDSQLVTHDYSPTPIGEAYRSLRTNIVFSKATGQVRTLVITSPAAGDGKSFTAANLAIALAQHKSNALLIDTDLRRGVLHNTFGCLKEPGMTNYLTGLAMIDEILNETHVPNLTLISCGSMVPNPSELLGSVRMHKFIEEVKRRFDMVIFDTPPLNAATDAVVLGTQVDAVAVVVLAEATNRDIAQRKMSLFETVPAKVIGVILNGTKAEMAHHGYSYYHY